jgi:hypothetical protein
LKVVKAIRGLGEVSSVVCMLHNASDLGDVWVASDRHVRLEKSRYCMCLTNRVFNLYRLYVLLWIRKK